jgi:glucose-6-phosphate 1-dehydrogenase
VTTPAAPPCAIVVFGASGDLTHRKLVPALYNLTLDGLLPDEVSLVGFARRDWTDETFTAGLRAACEEHSRRPVDDAVWDRFARNATYVRGSFDDANAYRALAERLTELDRDAGTAGNRLFYLATAPSHFPGILEHLRDAGLVREPGEDAFSRVIVEKPFGRDLATARELNEVVGRVLDESQTFRIDHYLGKETVQNILVFRLGNGIFEPLWNRRYVDHVQITVAESIGVEGRAGYFDRSGILRDMVQSHVLQLLTLVAMEPPARFEADAVRDEKVKVLRAIRPMSPEEVARSTVRARYGPGTVDGEAVPAYRDAEGVPADSDTETFAAVKFLVETWRWSGVPFWLRVGKRLPRRATSIAIVFRDPPLALFREAGCGLEPSVLELRIQPDEGISLAFGSKAPGQDIVVDPVRMDFRYATSFEEDTPEAYERLLLDAVEGDGTLFARRDEVELGWALIDTIRAGWAEAGPPLVEHAAGTWGPEESDIVLEREGRRWRNGEEPDPCR